MVEYHPISPIYQSFGEKVLPAIFVGYGCMRGRIWKGDILVADVEGRKILDA